MAELLHANFMENAVVILSTYNAFSTTSGSLQTKGGLGVEQSAHIGEQLTVNSVNITPSLGDIVYERERILTNNIFNASVGEFYFHNTITQSFKAIVTVHVDDTLEKNAIYTLHGVLTPSGWTLNSTFTGDITGIKFSINDTIINSINSAEILYTNPNLTGTTTIRFKANTLSITGASNDAGPYSSVPTTLNATGIDYTPNLLSSWETSPSSLQQAVDTLAERLSSISFQYEYFVSKSGNDVTGNGSLEKPFLTIGQAISASNSENNASGIIIHISAGTYNENLTIIKPNTTLRGRVHGNNKTTRIDGSVTINPRSSTGGIFVNYYTFQHLSIVSNTNNVIEYTGNQAGYLVVEDCMLYSSTPGVKGLALTNTIASKIDIIKTTINVSNGNSNAVYIASGSGITGTFSNCNIYGNSAPSVSINGSNNISFNYTYIDNAGGNNLIELLNTVIAYFSYCTFTNYQLNSNGFNISNATSLVLSHCTFNIPTNVSYNPLNPGSPPATTTGYVIKGPTGLGANVVYGACLFTPVSLVNNNYYWGTKAISNTINTVTYNTSFSSQA